MKNHKPTVSCICPTYNRYPSQPSLLEESVESFRLQDYDPGYRELLIINDTPGQRLRCNLPGVRVINLDERVPTLGEKYNRAIAQAMGEIILPWEDDDISLPGRISQAVEHLTREFQYWNPQRSWFWADGRLHSTHRHGVCHNASAFSHHAWGWVKGYPHITGNQDAEMDKRLKASFMVAPSLSDDPSEWQYIYRWGVSTCHLSGHPQHQAYYDQVGNWPIMVGEFRIEPKWYQPWDRITQTSLDGTRASL